MLDVPVEMRSNFSGHCGEGSAEGKKEIGPMGCPLRSTSYVTPIFPAILKRRDGEIERCKERGNDGLVQVQPGAGQEYQRLDQDLS